MSDVRYEFLDRITIQIHREQQSELAAGTLEDVRRFQAFEFYDRAKMLAISKAGGIQREINRLVREVLSQREASPEGSNTECIAMDRLTEFLSKLDLEDFRRVPIEGLLCAE
jgi:hypothetical protein